MFFAISIELLLQTLKIAQRKDRIGDVVEEPVEGAEAGGGTLEDPLGAFPPLGRIV